MNFKKIGLTALAGSLVATSLVAGEMAVTGSASMKVRHVDTGSAGKSFSMGNQLEFKGGGELDNGMNVALSFVIDQADDSTTGLANSPFDSHSVSIGSDALGTLVFHGEGGSSAQTAMDTTAAGDIWDNGYGISTTDDPKTSATSDNMIFYTLPTLADGVAITASYTPRGAGAEASSTAFGLAYTGVEGLSINYAQGENNATSSETADATTMKLSYAYGPVSVGVSQTEYDSQTMSNDQDVDSYNVSYTLSENISVSYGQDEISLPGVAGDTDIKTNAITGSYTTGGMGIAASTGTIDNAGFASGTTADEQWWEIDLSFAF